MSERMREKKRAINLALVWRPELKKIVRDIRGPALILILKR